MRRKHDELAGLGLGIGLAACASMLSGSIKCHRCEHHFKAKVKKECSTCDESIGSEADEDDVTCWQCERRGVYFHSRVEDHWRPRL